MDHYRDNLRHVVRPETNRQDSDRVLLDDWEALYLRQALPSYAAYHAKDAESEEIALAYAEYIDMVVREEERGHVYIYAHTEDAKRVLYETLETDRAWELNKTLRARFDEQFDRQG